VRKKCVQKFIHRGRHPFGEISIDNSEKVTTIALFITHLFTDGAKLIVLIYINPRIILTLLV